MGRCVDDARNHFYTLKNLYNFYYYDGSVERGGGIREKSKQLVYLLSEDEYVREERIKARKLRERFSGNTSISISTTSNIHEAYGNNHLAERLSKGIESEKRSTFFATAIITMGSI